MKPNETAIAIIEDNPDHSDLIAEELGEVFSDVRTFETLPDFFAAYRYPEPLVVIVDYKIRGGTGKTFLERVKADQLPFVCVGNSADGTLDLAVDFMKAGAQHFFVKPMNIPRLIDMIPELMGKAVLLGQQAEMKSELEKRVKTLTPEQRHIARLMLDFEDVSKAAALTGKAAETVRSHWKSASAKLNIERIEERIVAFRLLSE